MESPRRVTLLIGRNGTVQLIPADEDEEGGGPGGGGSGGLVALLALTFTCGLALNVAVAVAVATEPMLRKALFLRCLATLAFANALDCALNVSIAGIAVTSWMALAPRPASQLCRFSALTSQMTVLAQTSAVLAMVLERVSSVASVVAASAAPSTTSNVRVGFREQTSIRVATVVSSALMWFTWPSALTLAAAPAVIAPVRIFPNRYGCGVAGPTGPALWLVISTLVIGYLIPWICMAVVLASSARHVTRRRWRKQQLELAAQRRAANTAGGPGPSQAQNQGQVPPPPALWFSPDDSRFGSTSSSQLSLAVVLLFLYAALLTPQIMSTLTFQLVRVPLKRLPPPTTPQQWPANTGAYETVFVWMRFQFAAVSPGLVLIFHKEVRQRVERMLACLCRVCYCRCSRRLAPVTHNETYERAADVRTPVLFATDQGLFLRVTDHLWGDTPDEASTTISGPFTVSPPWTEVGPRYVFQFCDVALLDVKPASAAGQLRPLLADVTPESQRRTLGSKPTDWSRKNVRFASVVSEIPSIETCQVEEEPAATVVIIPKPEPASPVVPMPDSPVRWLPRNKRTTLELEIVSEDVNVIPVRPAASLAHAITTSAIDSSTFSLPPGKKLYPRTSHV